MTKITDILFNTYYKPYRRYILILFLIIIFLIIGNKIYNKSKPLLDKKIDIANANRRVKNADIYFFNAGWCPHCTKALKPWKDFVGTYDQTIINGYTINCIGGSKGVDCTSNNDAKVTEILQKFKVDQFPTIKLVKDKVTIDFDAKITQENLTKFVNSVL
jgi:thioredoxin-related protein